MFVLILLTEKLLYLLANLVLLSLSNNGEKSYKDVFGIKFRLIMTSNFLKIISLIMKVNTTKKQPHMADIDHKIISHFLCTHRLDSTKVDLDPYLMKDDLIFLPVKDHKNLKQIHGMDMDRYNERIKMLFTPYREKN